MKPDYVTKQDLAEAFDAFEAKLDAKLEAKLDAKLAAFEERLERRLSAQLASHIKAVQEWLATSIKIVDEKYADLPGRVAALEARSRP